MKVCVRDSLIPGAGAGLFAARPIAAEEVVTTYRGRAHRTADAIKLTDKSYLMRLGPQAYIDADSEWFLMEELGIPLSPPGIVDVGPGLVQVGGGPAPKDALGPEARVRAVAMDDTRMHEINAEKESRAREANPSSSSGQTGPECIAMGRFLNDARPYNCFFEKFSDRADVVALRDIEPGEELYVSYGKLYWAGSGVTRANRVRNEPIRTDPGAGDTAEVILSKT